MSSIIWPLFPLVLWRLLTLYSREHRDLSPPFETTQHGGWLRNLLGIFERYGIGDPFPWLLSGHPSLVFSLSWIPFPPVTWRLSTPLSRWHLECLHSEPQLYRYLFIGPLWKVESEAARYNYLFRLGQVGIVHVFKQLFWCV